MFGKRHDCTVSQMRFSCLSYWGFGWGACVLRACDVLLGGGGCSEQAACMREAPCCRKRTNTHHRRTRTWSLDVSTHGRNVESRPCMIQGGPVKLGRFRRLSHFQRFHFAETIRNLNISTCVPLRSFPCVLLSLTILFVRASCPQCWTCPPQ